jgi:VanZ family protein
MNLPLSKDKKGFYKLLFFVATIIVVFIFAIVPSDHIMENYIYADKIKHIFAFFTLSLLLNRASSSMAQRFRNMSALLLFGIGIEFVQYYLPARTSSIEDIFADVGGILLFQVLYSAWRVIRR